MTENKPIMIDGVDVSGCEAYKDEHCKDKTSIMFCNTNLCSNFPNCYFKQLARKTQECERLKRYLNEIRNQELFDLDIDWDEYETQCTSTEYSNIINLVEETLGEREDGRI